MHPMMLAAGTVHVLYIFKKGSSNVMKNETEIY